MKNNLELEKRKRRKKGKKCLGISINLGGCALAGILEEDFFGGEDGGDQTLWVAAAGVLDLVWSWSTKPVEEFCTQWFWGGTCQLFMKSPCVIGKAFWPEA